MASQQDPLLLQLQKSCEAGQRDYIGAATRAASSTVDHAAKLAAPFVEAWDAAMASATCEFRRNSHEWCVTVAGTLQFQCTAATPWVCVVNTTDSPAGSPWVPVDTPIAVGVMHKALGIKIPEKSYAYARFIGYRVLFDLLARLWMVRSEMPPAADDVLVFSADWFRQVSLATTGHYKSAGDRELKK